MKGDEPILVFDETAKNRLVKALGYKPIGTHIVDAEGKVLTDLELEPIDSNHFGGVLIGSRIPIKKDSSDLIKYFNKS